jgi:N-carbamoylputrescine amidase
MLEAWITIQRAHAVANGLPVITANRVGFEPAPAGPFGTGAPGEACRGQEFWGHSFITGPQGELLALAGAEEEVVLTAEIDPRRTEAVRRGWPFLRDRRIDAYGDILRRYRD